MSRHGRLTPPTLRVFVISLVLAVLAVGSVFFSVPLIGHYLHAHRFWVVTGAYALLAGGVILRGL
ncbi:MAG: hypothetical protein ACYC5H_15660 [Methylovirgula sp.]